MPRPPAPPNLSLRARTLLSLLRLRTLAPVAMARYARKHTRHYAEAYAGWDGASFEALPLLTKQDALRRSPYDFLARPLARKVTLYAETTGSLGSPTPSFFTPREFHAATLLAYITPYYDMLERTLRANRTCVNGLAFGFTVAGMSFGDLLANLGGLVANVGSRSTLATPERIARCIARLRPSIIAATPSDFLAWMRIVKEDHPAEYPEVVRELKVLLSTAELCADARVRRIEEAFDLVHVDIYACVEGFFSLPCPCGEKHVLDAYHTEVVDAEGHSLGREGTGRFVFTNLLKRSTPMVRYLLDDWVTLRRSECRYGFTRSVEPHGRYELSLAGDGGRVGVRPVEEAIFSHGLFGDYVLEVLPGKSRLRLERWEAAADESAILESLRQATGLEATIEVLPYGALSVPRAVRAAKPILRVIDRRPSATQRVPQLR